jgi:cobalt-zinc-cadmium efflux system protein
MTSDAPHEDHAHGHDHGHAHGHAHDHAHDHGKGHDHAHAHGHAAELRDLSRRRLLVALALTASFLVVEIAAGFWSGSLALLSDAGHMLTDAGALGLALWAQALSTRPRSDRKTFGYRRAEILAAAANGIVLGITAIGVIVEAIRRLPAPTRVEARIMLAVAAIGLVVNLVGAWNLTRGGTRNLNLRAAAVHMLADAAGSAAALVAAVLILALGWARADSITSIVISVLILVGGWRLLRDATHVLMEGVPEGIDVVALERVARETPGVCEVHDLHIWSIVDDAPIITAHVVLDPGAHGVEVARDVGRRIEDQVGSAHVTVQPEAAAAGERLYPTGTLVRRG